MHDTGNPRTPREIMWDFGMVAGETMGQDMDPYGILWEIIGDIQNSYMLAMERSGIIPSRRIQIEAIVNDYLANHYGDD